MNTTDQIINIFNKSANSYQKKFMDVSLYHDTFDIFCNHITKENTDILEIACGPGNITKYLLSIQPDFKIFGIDLAPKMIALSKTNNPKAEFILMNCRDISSLKKKYDGIMCGFALPYLSKEESRKLIADTSGLLRSGGILYLSTMEENSYNKSGVRSSSAGEQMYMYYHKAGYLVNSLKENNFKVIDLQRIEYPDGDGAITTDLIIIAGK